MTCQRHAGVGNMYIDGCRACDRDLDRVMRKGATCSNCGAPIYAKDRCRPCYVYHLRTGLERPESVIVANARRRFDREQIQRQIGRTI